MTPRPVTAVVPTHNRPELMRRAVQSIADQTYDGDIEIIVVFDACDAVLPDVTLPPTRSLRGLVNGRVRGLAGGRNTGILAASHDIVAFLDDDDHWAPSKLSEQMALLEQHPEAVLVGTAMMIDDGERHTVRLVPGSAITHQALLRGRMAGLHSSSFVVRREALLGELGMIDEDLPGSYGEDYDLLLRASAITPVAVVNRPLVIVTWQGRSHFLGRWEQYADALQFLLAKHPDLSSTRRGLGRIEAQIAFARAAAGQRGAGLRWAARAISHDPTRARSWLAVAIAMRIVTAERVVRVARRFGRSI